METFVKRVIIKENILLKKKICQKIYISDCNCSGGKDGNECDKSTGVCGACKKGFFGDFCDKGNYYF